MARVKMEKGVTLIAPHTEVVGDVRFTDQLYVSGRISGNVLAAGDNATLVISEEGCVAGEVRVPNVVINGRVEGDVFAANKVELAGHANVKGNLYYQLIEMQLGALVEGQLVHQNDSSGENVLKLNLDAVAE